MVTASGRSDHVRVQLRADTSRLTDNERRSLQHLVAAAKQMDIIYLAQANQKKDFNPQLDVFDKTKGFNFYPRDLTVAQINEYLLHHPELTAEMKSPFTKVYRVDNRLVSTPFSFHYADAMVETAEQLAQAAEYVSHEGLRRYLQLRADAFMTNEYRESDIAWVKLDHTAPFEVTIGPYEGSEDQLFGVKRYFEAIIGLPVHEENQKLLKYREHAVAFDQYLAEEFGYKPNFSAAPMTVIDEVIGTGGSRYGFIPAAYNLPNDPDIKREHGSRMVFVRNVMGARFDHMVMPIARRVLSPNCAVSLTKEEYLLGVVGHELSHGLGFHFEGEDFRELASPLEETKADVFGLLFLFFLADRRVIEKDVVRNVGMIHAVDGLRQMRVGLTEAHAVGARMQHNHFSYEILHERFYPFQDSLHRFAPRLFALCQSRDYEEAKKFVENCGSVTPQLEALIGSLDGIPVDIDPVFDEV